MSSREVYTVLNVLIAAVAALLLAMSVTARLLLRLGYPDCTPNVIRWSQRTMGKYALNDNFNLITLVRFLSMSVLAVVTGSDNLTHAKSNDYGWVPIVAYDIYICTFMTQLYFQSGGEGGRRKLLVSAAVLVLVPGSCVVLTIVLRETLGKDSLGWISTSGLCTSDHEFCVSFRSRFHYASH